MGCRRTKLFRLALICAGLLAIKAAWVAACAPGEPAARDDALARRDHLLARTLSPTYFDDHALTPGGVFQSEWQLVTLSMTAAALVNIAMDQPDTRTAALSACERIVEPMLDPRMRAFEVSQWGSDPLEDLAGSMGHVGYLGHLNLALGAYRVLGGDDRFEPVHRAVSHAIARRMGASPSWHLETYPGQIYTADNTVAVASLAVYDMVTGESHATTIGNWVDYSRERLLDPDNGLIVFAVDGTGRPLGRGRGSAAGYNSFYLPFIDARFAAEQYRQLREHMVIELPFGAVGVREHVSDVDFAGDVDTGPLLLGVSPSATGFSIAGARHGQDDGLAVGLLRTAEIAGFSGPCRSGRCYFTAPLVGDAILLAMRTATGWDRRFIGALVRPDTSARQSQAGFEAPARQARR